MPKNTAIMNISPGLLAKLLKLPPDVESVALMPCTCPHREPGCFGVLLLESDAFPPHGLGCPPPVVEAHYSENAAGEVSLEAFKGVDVEWSHPALDRPPVGT